ncbi:hypothetical protein PBY51_016836 [Eleginops maclovinus]|uniref:Uncharacterized protein n=1 Tax=Eleginops maclovinus TaxID=56733 RepID=A0AAN7WLL0_ELEMC|nr:hypothetical protein PBY51_016836 [Eleginops maclovinus]
MNPLSLLPHPHSSCVPAKTESTFCRFVSCSCRRLPFCVMSEGITSAPDSPPERTHAADDRRAAALATTHFPSRSQHHSHRQGGEEVSVVMTSSRPQLSLQRCRSHEEEGRGGCWEAECLPSGNYSGH